MKSTSLEKLNTYLAQWRGANAFLNTYADEHERLVIGFVQPEDPLAFVGVCFLHCVFVSGPTRWSNCDVRCHAVQTADGQTCVEASDPANHFLLRFEGPVVVGDGNTTFA